MCDNLLTCIVRAWEVEAKPIAVAPAMNTLMWSNELTNEHLLKICSVYQVTCIEPVSHPLQYYSIEHSEMRQVALAQGSFALPSCESLDVAIICVGVLWSSNTVDWEPDSL